MKTTASVLKAILAAGGLRAESPEATAMVVEPLVELGLVEWATGAAHGPHGTFYATARGCLVATGHEKAPSVTCPDCGGEKRILGQRCVMCSGHGAFSTDQWRRISS